MIQTCPVKTNRLEGNVISDGFGDVLSFFHK